MTARSGPPDMGKRLAEMERRLYALERQRGVRPHYLRDHLDTGRLRQVADVGQPQYSKQLGTWVPVDPVNVQFVWGQAADMTVGRGGAYLARKASTAQTLEWTVDVAATGTSTCRLRVNGVLVGATVTLASLATQVTAALAATIAIGDRVQVEVLTVGAGGKIPGIFVYY